jgi:hypothetical protein
MVRVELHESVPTEHGHGEWKIAASLEVEGTSFNLRDPEHQLDMSLSVISGDRRLLFSDDPEEWARRLPSAYHAPDLYAVVVHDDNPPAEPQIERRDVRLPEMGVPAAHA